jgi:hypothetical protein
VFPSFGGTFRKNPLLCKIQLKKDECPNINFKFRLECWACSLALVDLLLFEFTLKFTGIALPPLIGVDLFISAI